jgi:hypothetical protein
MKNCGSSSLPEHKEPLLRAILVDRTRSLLPAASINDKIGGTSGIGFVSAHRAPKDEMPKGTVGRKKMPIGCRERWEETWAAMWKDARGVNLRTTEVEEEEEMSEGEAATLYRKALSEAAKIAAESVSSGSKRAGSGQLESSKGFWKDLAGELG